MYPSSQKFGEQTFNLEYDTGIDSWRGDSHTLFLAFVRVDRRTVDSVDIGKAGVFDLVV